MMHLTCECNVKQGNISNAKNHIIKWIHTLENKWKEPKYYEAFQEQNNKNSIIFFISFSDNKKERELSKIPEARKFGEDLYDMCVKPGLWKEYKNIKSIRNSKKDSKIHVLIKFKIKQNKINEFKDHLFEFIDIIHQNEFNNTTVYESWQDSKDELSFIHLIEFKDKESEQKHKNAFYTQKFTKFLYSNYLQEPEFRYLDLIESVRRNGNRKRNH
ncbi:MAG: putative quinol monooxygenase [Nitrososphaeraceae archaeon]